MTLYSCDIPSDDKIGYAILEINKMLISDNLSPESSHPFDTLYNSDWKITDHKSPSGYYYKRLHLIKYDDLKLFDKVLHSGENSV